MSSKRPREQSQTSSTTWSPSPSPEPTPKAVRTALPADVSTCASPFLCTLPPTCNPPQNRPTPLESSSDIEAHYAKYHAHVCEERGCGCVFPDARLLELHQAECHDPLASIRKDRGEKIFACHLTTCSKMFLTPKARRLHLIQAHGYPKEYFFAVTNKGVGELLKRWGEGASMVRGKWAAREEVNDDMDDGSGSDIASDDEGEEEVHETQVDDAKMDGETEASGANGTQVQLQNGKESVGKYEDEASENKEDETMDTLMGAMGSLSLVPPKIRFGRGATRPGFGRGRAGIMQRGAAMARGRGGFNGAMGGIGRGMMSPQATTSGNIAMGGSARMDMQTQAPMRGILGGGFIRRGVHGPPATRGGMIRLNGNVPRGRGGGRAVQPARGRGISRGGTGGGSLGRGTIRGTTP
ncbi:uncharacterized protein LAESUDRAFT_664842 [Laetiporus sulphureus 93-53]|uniref:C2H2-type domain-containing protein n=1 Tax=Laetiporus sulphureus 93-53 TaxID=1314785 RepID=A0A165BG76_9APHY|nr:uncharacterized protein LAESUDRAFT_664842 [Laetiporus sulphureus 93-53]KZT00995.1 hypothetical protein LAESUDRAFT_664842 [Laetiporus sulphureus 93-53]